MSTHKSTGGTNNTKDVIYIDVDDEITAIIDKVQASDKKIVALVLPKRAAVLQSIVNMKLLKRGAGDAKKNLVLITSESGLLPLAGNVGIHVAKSLNTRPEVPDAPERASDRIDAVEEGDDAEDTIVDTSKTVGELSGQTSAGDDEDDEESIELDDEPSADDGLGGKAATRKQSKNKRFKIPDFNKFRLMLILAGVGVIALGVVGYAAVAVWPEATVTIQTDSQSVESNLVLTLKTAADTQLDAAKAIVPAQQQEVKKTLTQEAPATGQKNNGKKASGEITIINCTAGQSLTIPSGTGVSSGGQTFITQKSVTIPVGSVTCFKTGGTVATVDVVAIDVGTKSNVPAGNFTINGYSSKTKAYSDAAMSGGTDDIIKVISQADIDDAKQKITEQDTKPIRQELESALIGRDLFPMDVTFTAGEPETTLSAEANTAADTVTVTQTITYTMLGVKQDDLQKIITADVEKKIDTKKQSILSYGLDDAYFSLQGVNPDETSVAMQTTAVAGATLNVGSIKRQVAGKKAGDAKEIILASPGVANVTVEYSPFWVSSIPKKADKITVVIQEPKVTVNATEPSP